MHSLYWLRGIDVPVFIVWGKQDKIINVGVANRLKRYLKMLNNFDLNGVGHMSILEADIGGTALFDVFIKSEITVYWHTILKMKQGDYFSLLFCL